MWTAVIYPTHQHRHVQNRCVWQQKLLRTWVTEDRWGRYNITANNCKLHLIALAFQDSWMPAGLWCGFSQHANYLSLSRIQIASGGLLEQNFCVDFRPYTDFVIDFWTLILTSDKHNNTVYIKCNISLESITNNCNGGKTDSQWQWYIIKVKSHWDKIE